MITIKEGLEDTHMSMFEDFKEAIHYLVRDLDMTRENAAIVVAYRERTSVLDHRLANIAEALKVKK